MWSLLIAGSQRPMMRFCDCLRFLQAGYRVEFLVSPALGHVANAVGSHSEEMAKTAGTVRLNKISAADGPGGRSAIAFAHAIIIRLPDQVHHLSEFMPRKIMR